VVHSCTRPGTALRDSDSVRALIGFLFKVPKIHIICVRKSARVCYLVSHHTRRQISGPRGRRHWWASFLFGKEKRPEPLAIAVRCIIATVQ